MGAPSLWTHVDHIQNPEALSFVLERAKNLPANITNLSVEDADDIRFEAVAAHMHHIRTLGLCVRQRGTNFTTPSCAHTAFSTAAPLLRMLSFSPHRDARANGRCLVHSMFKIPTMGTHPEEADGVLSRRIN